MTGTEKSEIKFIPYLSERNNTGKLKVNIYFKVKTN